MKRLLLPALALIALPLAGCVYRMDVPQGNYVEQKQVSLLRVGMTREQVRYVLGSPVTVNPFRDDEWDYIYVERHGWDDPIQKNLFLTFTSNLGEIEVEVLNTTTGGYDSGTVDTQFLYAAVPITMGPGHYLILFTLPSGQRYKGELDI